MPFLGKTQAASTDLIFEDDTFYAKRTLEPVTPVWNSEVFLHLNRLP